MTNETFKKQMLELVCFMVTSARGLLHEPKNYGPFRLLDTASRLIDILSDNQYSSPELEKIKERIESGKFIVVEDESQATSFLNDLVLYIVELLKDQD